MPCRDVRIDLQGFSPSNPVFFKFAAVNTTAVAIVSTRRQFGITAQKRLVHPQNGLWQQ